MPKLFVVAHIRENLTLSSHLESLYLFFVRRLRSRRDIGDHYNDDHCLEHFSVEANTIIRTKDSRENGAVFINETEVLGLFIGWMEIDR